MLNVAKPLLAVVLFATLGQAGDAAVESIGVSEARVRAEIMPLFTEMQAAANVHDAEEHLTYFFRDPALVFVVNGRTIQGWDNLLAQQGAWWPAGKIAPTDDTHLPYRLIEGPSFQVLSPRHAMVTFILDARRESPDRVVWRPIAISQLWEKRAEGWRVIHVHESIGPERPMG